MENFASLNTHNLRNLCDEPANDTKGFRNGEKGLSLVGQGGRNGYRRCGLTWRTVVDFTRAIRETESYIRCYGNFHNGYWKAGETLVKTHHDFRRLFQVPNSAMCII